jgi:cytochrome P450
MHTLAQKFLASKTHEKTTNPATQSQLFETIYHSSLPSSEKSVNHLAQHGFGLIGAGGETIARVLGPTIFFILDTLGVEERLVEELREVMPNGEGDIPSLKILKGLPWLVRPQFSCEKCKGTDDLDGGD